ncbi:hypothetical protein Q5752_002810 [Cryptotrichosporon argae]
MYQPRAQQENVPPPPAPHISSPARAPSSARRDKHDSPTRPHKKAAPGSASHLRHQPYPPLAPIRASSGLGVDLLRRISLPAASGVARTAAPSTDSIAGRDIPTPDVDPARSLPSSEAFLSQYDAELDTLCRERAVLASRLKHSLARALTQAEGDDALRVWGDKRMWAVVACFDLVQGDNACLRRAEAIHTLQLELAKGDVEWAETRRKDAEAKVRALEREKRGLEDKVQALEEELEIANELE